MRRCGTETLPASDVASHGAKIGGHVIAHSSRVVEDFGPHASCYQRLPYICQCIALDPRIFLSGLAAVSREQGARCVVEQVEVMDELLALGNLGVILCVVIVDANKQDKDISARKIAATTIPALNTVVSVTSQQS